MNKRLNTYLSNRQYLVYNILFISLFMYFGEIIAAYVVRLIYNLAYQDSYLEILYRDVLDPKFNLYYNLGYSLVFAIIILILFRKFLIESWQKSKIELKSVLLFATFIGLPLAYGSIMVISVIVSPFIKEVPSNQLLIEEMFRVSPAIILFISVILAPLIEETIFRGIVFGGLHRKNRILAYLVSSLLFGFIHIAHAVYSGNFSEFYHILSYSAMGLVFAFVYEATGSIYSAYYLHMIWNLIVSFL